MPIERRSSSAQVRSILIAVVSVLFVGLLVVAVVRAATGQKTSVTRSASGGLWNTGSADTKAKAIAEDGPILIPDPAGEQKLPIFISHVGKDEDTGWYAFEARPPGAPEDCFLAWNAEAKRFEAPCVDDTYGIEGEGLRSFGADVTKDGDLVIDFTPGK